MPTSTPPPPASIPSRTAALRAWLHAFWPAAQALSAREKLRASAGAALGILVSALLAGWAVASPGPHNGQVLLAAALVAPLGASAVLIFAVPSSPLAQPWAVVGGNTVSALVGVACARWVPHAGMAAALAVGLAIAGMLGLRCLHPPGGASALLMVLGGHHDFAYALQPVMLDSALLVGAGLVYNHLTGRPWPQPYRAAPAPAAPGAHLTRHDLDAALAHYNQLVDVNPDDLQALLQYAEAAAYQRTLGELRCADAMSPNPTVARADMPLRQAWATMREQRVKALPVVDRQHHLVGIVTVADFMRQVDLDAHEGVGWHLRALLRRGAQRRSTARHTVGEIMTRQVRVASSERLLIDLVPVFSEGGHRHLPIIDAQRQVVGIITQSDLIRALYDNVRR